MAVTVPHTAYPPLYGAVNPLVVTESAAWAAPQSTDVVIVSYCSFSRVITGIAGMGATWASRFVSGYGAFYVGTTPSSAGNITITQTSTGSAYVCAILVRGLTSNAISGGGQTAATTTGALVNPTPVTGGLDQIVVSMMRGADATLNPVTFPVGSTPSSGWVITTPTATATTASAFAYRIPPGAVEGHVLTAQGAVGDTVEVFHMTLGVSSAPAAGAFTGWGVPRI